MERNVVNRSDILLIAVLIILSLVILFAYSFFKKSGSVKCEIIYNGKTVDVLDLSDMPDEGIITFKDNPHVKFEIKNNAIAFVESDCPDKICIKSGFLKYSGQMAACIPNRIVIKIIDGTGATNDAVDAVSG